MDVEVHGDTATVADLLVAMQSPADDVKVYKPLHRDRYGTCVGCVYNCCKSNDIPLDLVSAEAISARLGLSLSSFSRAYLRQDNSVTFPEFRKRPCPFLEKNLCTVYEGRALICRLYICTPMSDRLERLRCAVLLMGEAALRQRLLQLELGPKKWTEEYLQKDLLARHRSGLLDAKRYAEEVSLLERLIHANPYLLGATHEEVRLRDCCTSELWERLSSVPNMTKVGIP